MLFILFEQPPKTQFTMKCDKKENVRSWNQQVFDHFAWENDKLIVTDFVAQWIDELTDRCSFTEFSIFFCSGRFSCLLKARLQRRSEVELLLHEKIICTVDFLLNILLRDIWLFLYVSCRLEAVHSFCFTSVVFILMKLTVDLRRRSIK